MYGPGVTALINSNKQTADIMKSLEKFCLLIEKVSKAIENEAKEQKRCILWQLLGTLFENLLGNFLVGKPKTS